MKNLVKKLQELGFTGRGFDGIEMTQEELEKQIGFKLDEYKNSAQGNEYGGTDYTIYDEENEEHISIEILEGKVHDVIFEQ